ncbi:hypothetical protein A3F02_00440 [Candidatus Curtissbacteria bacterium RIFCSPHIGHO2_12_FULL_38_9b]|uniref:Uncharacterized protein n=2 Tax=Candidatus Curtissiibacteriota TaxID=1752717 RepID=A0A1F5GYZ7_9BACT|nr:MAG: hypothetical protein A3A48_02330 [Candidatus Curtissbacteria bacterium RIFCSPLOWO2_01_FULL_37_9]OGD97091.1 MAG: hypothetical protein A3F02_00440 [Candidatus Curtissbacteria bacterium RIFCSPHIGHO2_12_FULL_38_9b]
MLMENERVSNRTVMELRETAGEVRRNLARRFDAAHVCRTDIVKQTRGGENFVSTISLTITETHDPDTVVAVATCLKSLIDLPNAGTISWYMRGFIRKAIDEEIIEYADLIKTLAGQAPELLVLTDIRNRGLVSVE